MILPNRHSIRLKNYDYSSNGAYFVTICTKNREMLFGDIVDGKMVLNEFGEILNQAIQKTPEIRKNIQIDVYQIMPNHVHIIIIITDRRGVLQYAPTSTQFRSPSQTIGSIVRGIKSMTATQIRTKTGNREFPIWQRNYYEHIIRDEKDFDKIAWYIVNNPQMWDRDRNNLEIKEIL